MSDLPILSGILGLSFDTFFYSSSCVLMSCLNAEKVKKNAYVTKQNMHVFLTVTNSLKISV